jgi:hypothetical protein
VLAGEGAFETARDAMEDNVDYASSGMGDYEGECEVSVRSSAVTKTRTTSCGRCVPTRTNSGHGRGEHIPLVVAKVGGDIPVDGRGCENISPFEAALSRWRATRRRRRGSGRCRRCFTVPGGPALNTDKCQTGVRYDQMPIANGVILAGGACGLIDYPEDHAGFASRRELAAKRVPVWSFAGRADADGREGRAGDDQGAVVRPDGHPYAYYGELGGLAPSYGDGT